MSDEIDTQTSSTQHSHERDIHKPAGFETAISASERPQTYVIDRAATGIDIHNFQVKEYNSYM
jgi:hypothetical protein